MTESEIALNSLLNLKTIDFGKRFEEINKFADELGLNIISQKSNGFGNIALLFRKIIGKKEIPENIQIIEITTERKEKWFEFIKEKIQELKETENKTSDVWLIARDDSINGIIGLINCLRLEPGGENIRCIYDLDHKITLPIDWNSKPFSDILSNDLVINVIKDGKLGTYRHLRLPKDCDKIVSNEYFLNLGQMKDLSSLQWFDLKSFVPNNETYGINNTPITQVSISIYSSGLMFRDVMVATGIDP